MADKPSDKGKKPAAPAPAGSSLEKDIVVWAGVFVLLALVVLPAVLGAFNVDTGIFSGEGRFKEAFIGFVAKVFTMYTFFAIFISLLFIVLISYASLRRKQIIEAWYAARAPVFAPPGVSGPSLAGAGAGIHGPTAQGGNEQWLDIEQKINSANPADWRLAILEADIVLFNMLEQMGLPGKDLGEKLKSADRSFFSTLDEAWKGHKIRNTIAHEGSAYELSYTEARKVIDYYRRVFEEFYFI